MNRILCWLRGHQWSRYSYNKIQRVGTRRCKRCQLSEHKALPPLKVAA